MVYQTPHPASGVISSRDLVGSELNKSIPQRKFNERGVGIPRHYVQSRSGFKALTTKQNIYKAINLFLLALPPHPIFNVIWHPSRLNIHPDRSNLTFLQLSLCSCSALERFFASFVCLSYIGPSSGPSSRPEEGRSQLSLPAPFQAYASNVWLMTYAVLNRDDA